MKISKNARIWIYQADRNLSEKEVLEIQHEIDQFTSEWQAHQQALTASGFIKYQRFMVLCVDENQTAASGCSIDSSVRFLKSIESKYKVQLFDRMQVIYKINEEIFACSKDEFQHKIDRKIVNGDTLVFNNMVQSLNAFEKEWEVPAKDSWHAKIFNFK